MASDEDEMDFEDAMNQISDDDIPPTATNEDSSSGGEEQEAPENQEASSDGSSSESASSSSSESDDDAAAEPSSDSSSESESNDRTHSQQTRPPAARQTTASRKTTHVALEEIEADPDFWGIRRSGRARQTPQRLQFDASAATSDDDMPRKAKQAKKPRASSSSAKSSKRNLDDEDESFSEEDNEDDDYDGRKKKRKHAAARPKPSPSKHHKGSSNIAKQRRHADDDGEFPRFSTRGQGPKSYRESDEDKEDDEMVSEWTYVQETVDDEGDAIEKVDDHRYVVLNEDEQNFVVVPATHANAKVQLFIKWKGRSYLHATWESEEHLKQLKGYKKVENYLKKVSEDLAWRAFATREQQEQFDVDTELRRELLLEYRNVERVVAKRYALDGSDEIEYFCKWQGLPYCDCTWENGTLIAGIAQSEIDEFLDREQSEKVPTGGSKLPTRPNVQFVKLQEQPDYLKGGTLRDYQLDAVNWLTFTFLRGQNTILADEMGLGKTCQSICFLSHLFHKYNINGPFLVVAPLSTITAWYREFRKWAPDLNLVLYIGKPQSREIIRKYEFYREGRGKNTTMKLNVLLTTFEIILKDSQELSGIKWYSMVIDEAHRLKNEQGKLYDVLQSFATVHRLLVTGTPLQNTLKELWALLAFLQSKTSEKFASFEEFERVYGKLETENQVKELHDELKPLILRRLKRDVEKSLPAKVERILRVEMAPMQRTYYRWILTKNFAALNKNNHKNAATLQNIVVELKKCCNHPYLFDGAEEHAPTQAEQLKSMIINCGKMILLDKLLLRLKEAGHRVLIFSQMVRMLDILADYMNMRGFSYQRLDGSIGSEQRKIAMDRFNAPGSNDFCFLLSTRAGGLGINLATADTVILFDSDWNPQNDLQAQARAHRIGQKNVVNIYRLVTKGTVEEDIIERAKRKMVLEHLVIQSMDTSGSTVLKTSRNAADRFSSSDLQEILKFGAEDLFKQKDDDATEQTEDLDLDEILARAETHDTTDVSAHNDLLSSFKVADFGIANHTLDWDSIIPENERKKLEAEELDKTLQSTIINEPRKRKNVINYSEEQSTEGEKKAKKKKLAKSPKTTSGVDDDTSFTSQEIRQLCKSMRKFGSHDDAFDLLIQEAELRSKDEDALRALIEQIKRECQDAIDKAKAAAAEKKDLPAEDDKKEEKKEKEKDPMGYIGSVAINAPELIERVIDLDNLRKKIGNNELSFRVTASVKQSQGWLDWKAKDDAMLLVGVCRHGYGAWERIVADPTLGLTDKVNMSDTATGEGEKAKESSGKKLPQKPTPKQLSGRLGYLFKILRDEERHKQTSLNIKYKGIPISEIASKQPSEEKERKHKENGEIKEKSIKGKEKAVVDEGEEKKQKPTKQKDKKELKPKKEKQSKDIKPTKQTTLPGPVVTSPPLADADFNKWASTQLTKCKDSLKRFREMSMKKEELPKTIETIGDSIHNVVKELHPDQSEPAIQLANRLWQYACYNINNLTPEKVAGIYDKLKRKRENGAESSGGVEKKRKDENGLHNISSSSSSSSSATARTTKNSNSGQLRQGTILSSLKHSTS